MGSFETTDLQGLSHTLAFLSVAGNYVIADDNVGSMIHVYNASGEETATLLPKGHGENEILDIHQMLQTGDSTFVVFDAFFVHLGCRISAVCICPV